MTPRGIGDSTDDAAQPAAYPGETRDMRLYVAGRAPTCVRAIANLQGACAHWLPGRSHIEITTWWRTRTWLPRTRSSPGRRWSSACKRGDWLDPAAGADQMPIGDIKEETVRKWRASRLKAGPSSDPPFGPVTVAKAYRLLRAILNTAAKDKRIKENPCQIDGADKESSPERPVLSVAEVYQLADAITPRYRALVLLATFGRSRRPSTRWPGGS